MIHRWAPCRRRLAAGIEVCARPGCTAERRVWGDGKYEYRAREGAPWVREALRCDGAAMAKAPRSIDKGDEF